MKVRISFLIVVATALFINKALAKCDRLPADFSTACCKFTSLGLDENFSKIVNQLREQKLDEHLMECRVFEVLFKEMKWFEDNMIDKDAMWKELDERVQSEIWKAVTKSAIEQCAKEITESRDEIVKELAGPPFNISKEDCNPIFMSMATCFHLECFANCPKEDWTDEERCNEGKAWVNRCGDKIDSMKQFKNRESERQPKKE